MMPDVACRERVRIGPFLDALILGPTLGALIAFLLFEMTIRENQSFAVIALFGSPSFGLLVGWPYYLIVGAPMLWLVTRFGAPGFLPFGVAGVAANLASPLLAGPLGETRATPMELVGYGTIAAFVWCGMFGQVYAWLGGHGR